MTSYGEARKMRRGHSRPGHHPSGAWRWSLESGLRSKDSRAVRRRVVGKVPIEATRWLYITANRGSRRYQQKIFGKRDSNEITAGRQKRLHPEKQHVLLDVASYTERDVTVLGSTTSSATPG